VAQLIAERRCGGDRHDNEAATDRLMTGIAPRGQVAEGFAEGCAISGCDRALDRFDRRIDHRDIVHGYVGIERDGLGEAGFHQIQFVASELPVLLLARGPQLRMPELHRAHDVGKPRRGLLRCLGGNHQRRCRPYGGCGDRREIFRAFAHSLFLPLLAFLSRHRWNPLT